MDSPATSPRSEALMRVMDRINFRWGRDTVPMAACSPKASVKPFECVKKSNLKK